MQSNIKYRQTIIGLNQTWTLLASEHGVSQLLFPSHLASLAGMDQDIVLAGKMIENRSLFVEFGIIDQLEQYFDPPWRNVDV